MFGAPLKKGSPLPANIGILVAGNHRRYGPAGASDFGLWRGNMIRIRTFRSCRDEPLSSFRVEQKALWCPSIWIRGLLNYGETVGAYHTVPPLCVILTRSIFFALLTGSNFPLWWNKRSHEPDGQRNAVHLFAKG